MINTGLRNAWSLFRLRVHWNGFARRNARWAILTRPPVAEKRWSTEEFLRTGSDEIAEVLGRLEQHGIQPPQGAALDFGCGVGRLTFALGEHFREAIGIDVSEQMIALAITGNPRPDVCRFVHNPRPDLPFRDGTLDFVYSRFVLQHMSQSLARGYIAEFVRVLTPDGLCVFQLPEPEDDSVQGSALKRAVPLPVVRAFRRLRIAWRRGPQFPRMEMVGATQGEVCAWLRHAGGTIVQIWPDSSHGTQSPGYVYVARRQTGSRD
jgi:SAM-dependent methyltransferase